MCKCMCVYTCVCVCVNVCGCMLKYKVQNARKIIYQYSICVFLIFYSISIRFVRFLFPFFPKWKKEKKGKLRSLWSFWLNWKFLPQIILKHMQSLSCIRKSLYSFSNFCCPFAMGHQKLLFVHARSPFTVFFPVH